MLATIAFLSLSAGAAQPSLPRLAVASPKVAAERVMACGFDHVRLNEDGDLQEQVVQVTGVTEVPEAKMRCAVQVSLDTVRYVIFPEPANTEYWRLYSEMEGKGDDREAAWMQGEARDWLQQHGLLARLPAYEKGQTDELAFARQLEGLCGSKAKGTFRLFKGHVVLWPALPGKKGSMDFSTMECLISAAEVSGMPFGFVGNEYQPKK
jgi:hypothetical protein